MSAGIFVGMESQIIGGFHSVIDGLTSTYAGWMAGIFVSCISLFITYRAYETLAGKLQRPFEDIMWDVVRMLIIMAFVTNAGGYLDMTVAAINGIRDGVSGDQSIWALLDTVWAKAQTLGSKLYGMDDSMYVPVNGAIAEFIVWISVAFMAGVTAFVNLIAELILMLMLTTAPIFGFCLLWGWLRPTFNNWLQTILSCILTSLFSGLALQVVMNYVDHILKAATVVSEDSNIVTIAFQVGLAAVGAGLVMFVVYKLSCMLAGVAAQGAIQGMASAGISSVFSSSQNVTNSARDSLGSVGDAAANNLKSSPIINAGSNSVSSARNASIQTMMKNNS